MRSTATSACTPPGRASPSTTGAAPRRSGVSTDDIRIEANGKTYSFDELAEQPDEWWFTTDAITVRIPHEGAEPGDQHRVRVDLGLLIPYLGFVPDFSSSMHEIPPSLITAHEASGMRRELTEFAAEVWHSDTSMQEKFARFADEAPKLGATPADMGKLNMILTMHGRMDPRRWAEIMDRVIHVHGKFYGLDENGNEPSIDHEAIVDVLVDAGYTGYISSEWEGHAYTDVVSGWDMVRGHHDLLARLISARARV